MALPIALLACGPNPVDPQPTPDASINPDAQEPPPDAAAPEAACGDGVRSPGETCLEIAETFDIGPADLLEIGAVIPASFVMGAPGAAPTVVTLAGVPVTELAGVHATEVVVRDLNPTGGSDIVVLGDDGSIRIHADGREQGNGVAAPGAGRSGLDAARVVGDRFEILTIRAGSVERFELAADGTTVVASREVDGARGRFVGVLDPDEDGAQDIVVGGVEFTNGVAIDTYFQGSDFSDLVQADKVDCPGACSVAGMRVGEIYGGSPDDVALLVPGAIGGDLHVYIGGGFINEFSSPEEVTSSNVDDFEIGNLSGLQPRPDLAVLSECTLRVFPSVPLGQGTVSYLFGDPITVAAPDGHCPTLVAVSDIDGDGADELITASSQDAQVVVYRHNW